MGGVSLGENNKHANQLTVGILGGLGPEATVECYKSIIDQTPAKNDQEHLHILIDNNPKIPDRTKAILKGGSSPVPKMKTSARRLQVAGADFLIIPCNTAHYFLEKIEKAIEIPILNMVQATVNELTDATSAGLLATSGTIKTGLYQNYVKGQAEIITPSQKYQEVVMEVIYGEEGIKSGYKNERLKEKLLAAINHLKEKGAEAIISGCTEIRLVLETSDLEGTKLLLPIDIVARETVHRALMGERPKYLDDDFH